MLMILGVKSYAHGERKKEKMNVAPLTWVRGAQSPICYKHAGDIKFHIIKSGHLTKKASSLCYCHQYVVLKQYLKKVHCQLAFR